MTMLVTSSAEILTAWELPTDPYATQIAEQITASTIQWQTTLPDGSHLHLLKIYAPVVQREELFLGNVLLNDFLFKAVRAAVSECGISRCAQVANDLESAYFIVHGQLDMNRLQQAYRGILQAQIGELYLGDEDSERGIHGHVKTMLTFYKANIEPFPIFIIPHDLLPLLLRRVLDWLLELSSENGVRVLANVSHLPDHVAAPRRINVILAVLSFFFSRDGREMQSFHYFLIEAIKDKRLPEHLVCQSFGVDKIEELTKQHFNKMKASPETVNFQALAQAIAIWSGKVQSAIEEQRVEEVAPWMMSKMLPESAEQVAQRIATGVQLGFQTIQSNRSVNSVKEIACRFCGSDLAVIQECHIIGGVNSGKWLNQSMRKTSNRFCVRCATASYLVTKRLSLQFDGIFPIPKFYNTIFHYGHHSDADLQTIQRQIDFLLTYAPKTKFGIEELEVMLDDVKQSEIARQFQEELPTMSQAEIVGALSRLAHPLREPAREVIAEMQNDVRAEVLALGQGRNRLFVFIMPQFQVRGKESVDFIQKRFSSSRLAAFTLLALLRSVCNCDGSYHYQSLPQLSDEQQEGVFYVGNRPIQADAHLEKYGAIVNFARRVTRYRKGHSLLGDWILLAERLLNEPLGIFSDILKASPIRSRDDFDDRQMRYNRLSNDWAEAKGLGVVDSQEYIALYKTLHDIAKESST